MRSLVNAVLKKYQELHTELLPKAILSTVHFAEDM